MLTKLRQYAEEIQHLESILSLLNWDLNTYMPSGGLTGRSQQQATLGQIVQAKKQSAELGELLEAALREVAGQPYESDEASLVRVMHRNYEKDKCVPPEYVGRLLAHSAKISRVWEEAKVENDFKKVVPLLEQTLDLSLEYASFFPDSKHVADPLIAESDFGMTTAELEPLFAELRRHLVPMINQVTARKCVGSECLQQSFKRRDQLAFGKRIIEQLGFNFDNGRQDLSEHPFMTRIGHNDVRITTRVTRTDFGEALFSSLHEAGHALYEMGIAPNLAGTPLYSGTSSGVHESQSRLWENIVGRSASFWQHFYPKLQEFFPAQFANVPIDMFYQAINLVRRSSIRTAADELTYNLHVIIRFDLELAMLEGRLAVRDLPQAWRERYQSDLGVTPANDREGVLQDIHWYSDLIGGQFQGYTLGNIMSCQFFAAANKAYPHIQGEIAQGRFTTLHSWLRDHVYRHGSKFTANELILLATGSPLSLNSYLEYLQAKFLNRQ